MSDKPTVVERVKIGAAELLVSISGSTLLPTADGAACCCSTSSSVVKRGS